MIQFISGAFPFSAVGVPTQGLTYKQIASRLSSANQYGVFVRLTSEGVSYQPRSAKRRILQKYYRTKGKNDDFLKKNALKGKMNRHSGIKDYAKLCQI